VVMHFRYSRFWSRIRQGRSHAIGHRRTRVPGMASRLCWESRRSLTGRLSHLWAEWACHRQPDNVDSRGPLV